MSKDGHSFDKSFKTIELTIAIFWSAIGFIALALKGSCYGLNEIGDFLAGWFSPLAFYFLVRGFYIQTVELREARNEYRLSREAHEAQVVAHSEALEFEKVKTMLDLARKHLDSYAFPDLDKDQKAFSLEVSKRLSTQDFKALDSLAGAFSKDEKFQQKLAKMKEVLAANRRPLAIVYNLAVDKGLGEKLIQELTAHPSYKTFSEAMSLSISAELAQYVVAGSDDLREEAFSKISDMLGTPSSFFYHYRSRFGNQYLSDLEVYRNYLKQRKI